MLTSRFLWEMSPALTRNDAVHPLRVTKYLLYQNVTTDQLVVAESTSARGDPHMGLRIDSPEAGRTKQIELVRNCIGRRVRSTAHPQHSRRRRPH